MAPTLQASPSADGTDVATAASPRRLGRQPALDGLRGVAWLVVFVAHANLDDHLAVGQVAMFVFFALSGFLITSMLVEEREATGGISLWNFFARRVLRLLPALVLFLVAWSVVVAAAGHEPWMSTVPGDGPGGAVTPWVALQGVGAGLGYVTNWCEVFGLFTGYVPLGHLWSLAVEEQFYLVWAPLLALLLARSRRAAGAVALGLASLSFADVLVLRHAGSITLAVDMGTDTRCGAFLVGAAAALAWHREWRPRAWRHRTQGGPVVVGALGALGAATWVFAHPVRPWAFGLTWVGVSLAAAALVRSVVVSGAAGRPGRALAHPVLTYLGRRSYALYLWHYVWLTWLRGLGLAGSGAALVATLVCAEASWRLVEARALRHKARFCSAARAPAPAR